jgi:hypothetical protein
MRGFPRLTAPNPPNRLLADIREHRLPTSLNTVGCLHKVAHSLPAQSRMRSLQLRMADSRWDMAVHHNSLQPATVSKACLMVVHQARVVTVVLSSHRPNNGASQLLRKGLQAAPMLSTKARRLVLG